MKLKLIVAALGLIASASSFAMIPQPQTVGGGDLFLVVYEQSASNGAPDQSFTLDLGINTDTFYTNRASFQQWATLTASTDAIWNQFLSTSYLPALQFAVIGAKATAKSTDAGVASAVFSTVAAGDEANVVSADPSSQNSNQQLSSMIGGQINSYTQNVSGTGTHLTKTVGESVNAVGSNSYFQDTNMSSFNALLHFSNNNAVGSTGVEFTQLYRSPIGRGKAAQAVQANTVSFVQSGNDYVLNYGTAAAPVTPVPEASTYALLLAGLGALGFVARRRQQR